MSQPDPEQHLIFDDTMVGSGPAPPRPAPASVDPYPVQGWDRYEFLRVLGQGGMGTVYMARDLRLERVVALKFILRGDDDVARRFQQEARVQAGIDHPNICKVYETGEVAGKSYIAMQYITGRPLDQAAPEMTLPEKVHVIRDAAVALHEAHRNGVIHRDIKPPNLMIERLDDGRLRPVVMDFGIARTGSTQPGSLALTQDGTLMGTPAYMSPEQARGEHQNVDRRSDVYSLGATLYELLTGMPPFAGQALVEVLSQVLDREPPPLRQRVPTLPVDLETITLKCLSKDPSQRYDSAKALADDLQRYIDGEPIVARKHSLVYRVRTRIRRNKALFAASAVALLCLLSAVAIAIRGRVAAARQARLGAEQVARARQLGQDTKEIEWFLRTVYVLPAHDTSLDQTLIRTRMLHLQQSLDTLGTEGGSLAHLALGRGYLALHENTQAETHLKAAWALGNRSLELHYALGRVLGLRFYEAMRNERQSGDRQWVEERRKLRETEFLQPARRHLAESSDIQLESTSFLKGLIAYYNNQQDDALKYAAQAKHEASWLYEADLLQGDVYYERAFEAYQRRDHAQVEQSIEAAQAHYQAAAETGRSDVTIQEALADLWLLKMKQQKRRGQSPEPLLAAALAPCQAAIQLSPLRTRGYQQAAAAHLYVASYVRQQGRDPAQLVNALIAIAKQGIARGAADAQLYTALGAGVLFTVLYEQEHGLSHRMQIDDAIRWQQQALALNPAFPWALNDLAGTYLFRAQERLQHGESAEADLNEGIRYTEQAIHVDRSYANGYGNLVYFRYLLASEQVDHGRDPSENVRLGAEAASVCTQREPENPSCYSNLALLRLTEARWEASDPKRSEPLTNALAQATSSFEAALQRGDRSVELLENFASAHVLSANHAAERGADPAAVLAQAQHPLDQCRKENPQEAACERVAAELALAWAQSSSGRAASKTRDQALAAANAAVALNPRASKMYQVQAQVRLARARAAQASRASRRHIDPELDAGLVAVERGLALNPRDARLFALRGSLHRVRWQTTSDPTLREAALQAARTALQAALTYNPRLALEYAAVIEALAGAARSR